MDQCAIVDITSLPRGIIVLASLLVAIAGTIYAISYSRSMSDGGNTADCRTLISETVIFVCNLFESNRRTQWIRM